jgi:hypothetical protein
MGTSDDKPLYIILRKPIVRTVFASVVVLLLAESRALSMPLFARRLGVSCTFCHTTPPRLNETGHEFRAAGFRMPQWIGKDNLPFRFFDYTSVRLQVNHRVTRSSNATATNTVNDLTFHAFELYPMTGSWGKYLSSNVKFTFLPHQDPVIENAYLRVNAGNLETFMIARAGVFHPFDGYGASDSPATLSRPLLQTTENRADQPTYFRTWGFDQLGGEIGFKHRGTTVGVALLNGVVLHEKNGRLAAFAAQGGPLTRSSPLPMHQFPDMQVFVNQALHPDGGGVSFHFYRGNLMLPRSGEGGSFRNTFDRAAVYGSYPIARRLHLFGGFQRGRDTTAAGERFPSDGFFVEGMVPITDLTSAGARYDWVDPAETRAGNEVRAMTAYLNAWFFQQFRIVAEYQYKQTPRDLSSIQRDHTLQSRFIFIK